MSSQPPNNGNGGANNSGNAGASMAFSLAILAAGSLVPLHYPLVEWSTNVSRRDNPVTDHLFEVEKYQNNPGSDAATRTT